MAVLTFSDLLRIANATRGDKTGAAYAREVKKAAGNDNVDPTQYNKAWNESMKSMETSENRNLNVGGVVPTVSDLLTSQEGGKYSYKEISDTINSRNVISTIFDEKGGMKGFDDILSGVLKSALSQITDEYSNQTKLLEDVNTKTGLTGKLSRDFRQEIQNASPRLAQLGIDFQELANSSIRLVENSGRFNLINQQTFERAAEVGQAMLGSMEKLVEMLPEFERVGIGAKGTINAIETAGKRSLELGLSSQKVGQGLRENIGRLNEFGFQNGINGLTRMVQKSIEFRTSMESVAQIADKVFSPEGALELSANLQVLGGAIGAFNDPLKLMYMATNNVEGLQDALIDAAGSLATYNEEQGKFEVTGVNLRRLREMATALGVDYKELSRTAVATAERMSANQMLAGLAIDDEDKEFLTNISQMKDGRMTIDIQSEEMKKIFGANEIALEDLDKNQAQLLLQYRDEFKKLTSDEIVRNQATDIENIRRDVSFMVKSIAVSGSQEIRDTFKKLVDMGKLSDISRELIEKGNTAVVNELKSFGSETRNFIDKQKGKVESPQTKVTEEKAKQIAQEESKKQKETEQSTKNVKTTNEYVFKGGPSLVDGWMREIGKNASIYGDFMQVNKDEYTTPNTAKK